MVLSSRHEYLHVLSEINLVFILKNEIEEGWRENKLIRIFKDFFHGY